MQIDLDCDPLELGWYVAQLELVERDFHDPAAVSLKFGLDLSGLERSVWGSESTRTAAILLHAATGGRGSVPAPSEEFFQDMVGRDVYLEFHGDGRTFGIHADVPCDIGLVAQSSARWQDVGF